MIYRIDIRKRVHEYNIMNEWFWYQECECPNQKNKILWQTDDGLNGHMSIGCLYHIQESWQVKAEMSRVIKYFGKRFYFVGTFFPYQISLGITLRWFEQSPHLRLYVGPFKLAIGGL